MRHVILILGSLLLVACGEAPGDDGGPGDAGRMDAGADSGPVDAGRDGGVDAGPPCDLSDHAGCSMGELCCEIAGAPRCVPTTPLRCTACGVACDGTTTNACADRTCACGSDPACTGGMPICDPKFGRCLGCVGASDCAGQQCVGETCVDCDPADGAGCGGTTPTCDATTFTCVACSMSPDDCPSPLTCTSSGACAGCDPSTHLGCDTPTVPICDAASTVCRACASHAECMAERGLDFCLADGRCAACDPADDGGCSGSTPVCREGAGAPSCAPCASDGECAGRSGTPVCSDTGASAGSCVICDAGDASACPASAPVCDAARNLCVQCVVDGDCSGGTPICGAGNTCRACTSSAECTGVASGGVCATAGMNVGACVECDFVDRSACTGATPNCDFVANMCIAGCLSHLHCSGSTPICDMGTCRRCMGDDDCAAIGAGTCGGSGACG